MAILNLPWCDFVVAMDPERHPHRENIGNYFDDFFWKNHCYPKLHTFYYGIILPELVYPRHPLGLSIFDYRQYLFIIIPHVLPFHRSSPPNSYTPRFCHFHCIKVQPTWNLKTSYNTCMSKFCSMKHTRITSFQKHCTVGSVVRLMYRESY